MIYRIDFTSFRRIGKYPYTVSFQRKGISVFATILPVLSVNNYTDTFSVVWIGSKQRNWMVSQVETTPVSK